MCFLAFWLGYKLYTHSVVLYTIRDHLEVYNYVNAFHLTLEWWNKYHNIIKMLRTFILSFHCCSLAFLAILYAFLPSYLHPRRPVNTQKGAFQAAKWGYPVIFLGICVFYLQIPRSWQEENVNKAVLAGTSLDKWPVEEGVRNAGGKLQEFYPGIPYIPSYLYSRNETTSIAAFLRLL